MERLDLSVSLTKARRHHSKGLRWPLVLRFALRDFRGGLRGFAVFLASIVLGVAAITGIGSVSLSLKGGLAQQGRAILGEDVSFDVSQRELSASERDFLGQQGRLSPWRGAMTARRLWSRSRFTAEFVRYGVTSAAVGAPSTQFTSHGPSAVMKVTEPAPTHASCTIRAGM
jgi:hypothetical protein